MQLPPRLCRGLATAFFALFCLLGNVPGLYASDGNDIEAPPFPTTMITVERAGEALEIPVEVAHTNPQRRYGLMHRQSLAAGHGMIFIFESEAYRSFWMKNTLIPLDMVFFDARGQFVNVIANVPPLTLISRRSTGPAQYVLELNAGEAEKWGIGAGSRLQLPVIFDAE